MEKKLKEHCSIISGYAFKSSDLHESGDIPVVKIGNISNGKSIIIDNATQYVSNSFLSIDRKFHIYKGDVLISLTGSHMNQPNSMVGRSCRNYNDVLFLLNQRAGKVMSKENTNQDYLYYLLNTKALKDSIVNRAYGAANQANVSPTDIMNIKWDFPNIYKQEIVGEILAAYDKLIVANNKRIKALEQMAENLYKEWFVRFRFPGHDTAEFENGIPKGWKIERLGKVANISTGKSNRQDADENGLYPFFDRSQEVKRSNIWLKDCEGIIVPGEGTSFIPRYYYGKFDLHQRCYCVEPKYKGIGLFLFYMLKMNRHYFLSVATGATVPSLRQNNFVSMKFIMPSLDVCNSFNDIVSLNLSQINRLKEVNENLIKQRDLLLPRLMSGKLEVQ